MSSQIVYKHTMGTKRRKILRVTEGVKNLGVKAIFELNFRETKARVFQV